MKYSLKLEELAMFLLGIFMFSKLSLSWWFFIGLFFVPDIGMFGYIVNQKTGAFTYNLFHHKGIALVLYFVGIWQQSEWLQFIGIILFAHVSFDRMLGYGLKYKDNFNNTHLGKIGNQ
ncbi:DUF4260 domain-containing protein [Galbibacter pacificus]|uniref:DUF4260 domain-containing protein n=1 Tax=Galbibacter pacificus TaxID=2996052 RepID=A0ABT6FSG8_9FLAO|nr:DUF4260 domain-containing protein [Galbibacter pacificus]MDG3582666.1 DUF4260 domain-containing protein [Galbibacter pacificus]MDG3586215.1 DUF4260 domain-containing protein [Galbibacter pacificus]